MNTAIDLSKVDSIVAKTGKTREMAIPVLQGVQEAFRYIPIAAVERIAETTEMTESQLFGIATFYAQFRLTPVGETVVKVCHGTACHVSGADGLTQALEARLGLKDGETSRDMKYTLSNVACVGCCSLAPVVVMGDRTYANLDRRKVAEIIDNLEAKGTEG